MDTLPAIAGDLDEVIARALDEDLGPDGDVTSEAVVPPDAVCTGRAVAKEAGVVAGLPVFERAFRLRDPGVRVDLRAQDGERVRSGQVLAELAGRARSILAAERVALNFLSHLSGVATLTRGYVDACGESGSVVLHTRKTIPGLRALQRYAVEVGGGRLHRGSLSDGVLIKDNHVRLAGGVGEAVRRATKKLENSLEIEAEVETLEELEEALDAGADAILLDNASVELVERAAELIDGRVPLEISGGVDADGIRALRPYAPLRISVGRLTHSASALDVSLELAPAS